LPRFRTFLLCFSFATLIFCFGAISQYSSFIKIILHKTLLQFTTSHHV
jgi:hypothetical protein